MLELHPEDRRVRAKLAALELQNGPEQVRDSARAALESLASDEEFGVIALRALTKDALRRQDLPAALSWSGRASETPSVEFSDRMLRLQALFAAKSSAYDSWLSDLEKRAFENPQFALELGKWKVIAMGPQIAAAWLERAPKSIQDDPAISALRAHCYSALGSSERSRVSHTLERLARTRSVAPCLPGTSAGGAREPEEIGANVEARGGGGGKAARAASSSAGHGKR